jgi:hypothetical protein
MQINLDDESDEEEDEPDEGETPNEGAEASVRKSLFDRS